MSSRPPSPTSSSSNSNTTSQITNIILNETLNDGLTIPTNIQGFDISSNMITDTSFSTIVNNLIDVQIDESLDSQVVILNDTSSNILLEQIKGYAQEIQCSDFQGKEL